MDKRVNGRVKGAAGTMRSAARRSAVAEDRLRTVFDSVPDMVAMVDVDGRLLFVSPSAQRLLGVHTERLLGRSLYELIHNSDSELVRRYQQQVISAGDDASCEFRVRHANGNTIWVEMLGHRSGHDELVVVLRDTSSCHHAAVQEAEKLRRLENQIEDDARQLALAEEMLGRQVEKHKRDQEALELSEKRYTALVENTLTGIFVHDGRKLIFCNERFAQIFGFDRGCIDSIDTDRLFAGGRSIENLLANLGHEELLEGKSCQGDRVLVKLSRAKIACHGQEMVIGNVIDITEQIVMNERMRESKAELHALSAQLMAAQESERKRIANELHDGLGQSLSAIKFAVENIWRTTDHVMFPEQATRLGAIIEAIRDSIEEVRRVSMDLRPSILDDLGLVATIGWFCREFGQLSPEIGVHRNITAKESDIPDEVKVVVFRIIQEAFHNISRHAQADQVELDLHRHEDVLQLQIRDNGCGIAGIDRSPCAKGLGLMSMRERAEQTHGEFRIDSVPGCGTTISVRWSNGSARSGGMVNLMP